MKVDLQVNDQGSNNKTLTKIENNGSNHTRNYYSDLEIHILEPTKLKIEVLNCKKMNY